MPFPPAPRVVFNRNPLEQVIAQVMFPPILRIAAEEPATFQERIRASYPLYAREDVVTFPANMGPIVNKLGRPPQAVRHAFRSVDGRRVIYLTRDFVAFQESAYTRWEDFHDALEMAVSSLIAVYNPSITTRVGLRYINAIVRSKIGFPVATPWSDLVKAPLLGLLARSDIRGRVTEDTGATTIELMDVPGASVRIIHGVRLTATDQSPEEAYLIDSDFFATGQRSIADAMGTMGRFNEHSGALFRWAITERLFNALDPVPVDGARHALRGGIPSAD
jgi:uncharacterized protein (TIGR04255 family)